VEILHNITKNFATVHYKLSQFQKTSKNKLCVVSARVVCNNINLTREWSGPPAIINKFTFGVLSERVDALTTQFTIDTQIIHVLTFRTHLLSTCEVRYMLQRHITLFKVLCTLRIKENVVSTEKLACLSL